MAFYLCVVGGCVHLLNVSAVYAFFFFFILFFPLKIHTMLISPDMPFYIIFIYFSIYFSGTQKKKHCHFIFYLRCCISYRLGAFLPACALAPNGLFVPV